MRKIIKLADLPLNTTHWHIQIILSSNNLSGSSFYNNYLSSLWALAGKIILSVLFGILVLSLVATSQEAEASHSSIISPLTGPSGTTFSLESNHPVEGTAPANSDVVIIEAFVYYDPDSNAVFSTSPTTCATSLPTGADRMWEARNAAGVVQFIHNNIDSTASTHTFDFAFGSGDPAAFAFTGAGSYIPASPGTINWEEINSVGTVIGNPDATFQTGLYILVTCAFIDLNEDRVWQSATESSAIISESFLVTFPPGPTLSVSAMNPITSDRFGGPMVIEVVVADLALQEVNVPVGEPDVTVNGGTLRMAQATDGNWYGYFADVQQASGADSLVGSPGLGLDFGKFCGQTTIHTVFDPSVAFLTAPFGSTMGVTIPRAGGISGSVDGSSFLPSLPYSDCTGGITGGTLENHVVRDAPTLNTNALLNGQIGIDPNVWPVIQLYDFVDLGSVVVTYNRPGGSETLTAEFSETMGDFASLSLDRTVYPRGSDVHVTITDLQLNIDPTDPDSWSFATTPGGTAVYYQLFDENGFTDADGTAGAVDLTPNLSNLLFEFNGVLEIEPDATAILTDVLNLQDNDDQRIMVPGDISTAFTDLGTIAAGSQPITFTEMGNNVGIFSSFDESDKSGLYVTDDAIRGSSGTINYNATPTSIVVAFFSAILDIIPNDDEWNSGEEISILLTERDANKNSRADEDLDLNNPGVDHIPTLETGTPFTLETLSSATLELTPITFQVQPVSHRAILSTTVPIPLAGGFPFHDFILTFPETYSNLYSTSVHDPSGSFTGTNWFNYDVRSIGTALGATTVDVFMITPTQSAQIVHTSAPLQGIVNLDDAAFGDPYGMIGTEPVSLFFSFPTTLDPAPAGLSMPIVADFFSFGYFNDGVNPSERVANQVVRVEAEETGDNTNDFEGSLEFLMLNQLNILDTSIYAGLSPIADDPTFIVIEDLTDEDAPRLQVNDIDASGLVTIAADQEDAPAHSGVIAFDAITYTAGDTAVLTLADTDLNSDSDLIDIFIPVDPSAFPADVARDTIGAAGLPDLATAFPLGQVVEVTIDDQRWSSGLAANGGACGGLSGSPDDGLFATGIAFVETAVASGQFQADFEVPSTFCNSSTGLIESTSGKVLEVNYFDFRDASGEMLEVGDGAGIDLLPSDPPIIYAAISGDGRIVLEWLPPVDDGGSPVIDYIVEFRTGANPFAVSPDGIGTSPSAVVTGLTNGVTYEFQVTPVTALGNGITSFIVAGTPTGPSLDFNESEYTLGGNARITLVDSSQDGNPGVRDIVVVTVSSPSGSIPETLRETEFNSGIFDNDNSGGLLMISGDPSIPDQNLFVDLSAVNDDVIDVDFGGLNDQAFVTIRGFGGLQADEDKHVTLNKSAFVINSNAEIRVFDPDRNTNPDRVQRYDILVEAIDPGTLAVKNSLFFKMLELNNDSDTFRSKKFIFLTEGDNDPAAFHFHVDVGDTVRVTHPSVTFGIDEFSTASITPDPQTGPPTVLVNVDPTAALTCDNGADPRDGICPEWMPALPTEGLEIEVNGIDYTRPCTPLLVDTSGGYVPSVDHPDYLTVNVCPSPNTLDVFVEIDYMPGYKPSQEAVEDVIEVFQNAPDLINLHVLVDQVLPFNLVIPFNPATPPGPNDPPSYFQLKDAFFGTFEEQTLYSGQAADDYLTGKRQVYHYGQFIHKYEECTLCSGTADNANDFVVSLGAWAGSDANGDGGIGSIRQQSGTLLHELAHNFDLKHGGDDSTNCKVNYLSALNYMWQFPLLGLDLLDLSRSQLATLNENNLDEPDGIGASDPAGLQTIIGDTNVAPEVVSTGTAINWNGDDDGIGNEDFTDEDVLRNVNHIQGVEGCERTTVDTIMDGHDDWALMKFVSRTLPHYSDGVTYSVDDDLITPDLTEFPVTPALAAEPPAPDVVTLSETAFPDEITISSFASTPITLVGSASFSQTITSFDVTGTPVGGTVDAPVLGVDPTEATTTFHPDGTTREMSFQFTISTDTPRTSEPATVTILQNNSPDATSQTVGTFKNTDVTIVLEGTDVDGDALQFSIDETIAEGSIGDVTTQLSDTQLEVTFTPGLDFIGTDSFTFYVIDEFGASSTTATVDIIVTNPPTIDEIIAPLDPIQIDTNVDGTVKVSDDDLADTLTITWDWGDGTAADSQTINGVDRTGVQETLMFSHTYTEANIYTVTVTATDVGGTVTDTFEYITIYDPAGGFVTGGGFINSPEGAYIEDPTLTGKANFGFVSKYKKGQSVPEGNTQFNFKTADLNFHSTSYDWLVIAGAKATYKGDGTINGEGEYKFLLSAIDADKNENDSHETDKIRIKIWTEDGAGNETIVYDNQVVGNDGDDANPSTEIAGGSIVIHDGKKNK